MDAFGEGNGTILFTVACCQFAECRTVCYGILESVNKTFAENGIAVPFNRTDVHLSNE